MIKKYDKPTASDIVAVTEFKTMLRIRSMVKSPKGKAAILLEYDRQVRSKSNGCDIRLRKKT